MKNLKIILITIVVACLGFSCEDDGGSSAIPLNDGAVPNMVKSATTDSFFDLVKVLNGENVTISFRAEVAQGNPVSIDVVGIYKTNLGPVYAATLFSNVSLPQDFDFSISDIVAKFAEIDSSADILVGDVLTITLRFTMADGTVLNIINDDGNNNVGTNIQTNVDLFTYAINYPVSCPTMLQGNYISTVVSSNIGLGNFRSPQPVTITQPSTGTYILSDGTADIFGPDFPIGLQFTDVCGTITVTEDSIDFPGQVAWITNSATLNQNTGVITLDLTYTATSCCGLAGIQYVLQLSPN